MLSVPRKTQAFQDFQKFFLEMISISGVGSNDAVTMLLERTERTTERTDDVKGYSSSSTQAGPSPTKNGGVLHMKSINWDEIPETITKDQFYRICHISKQTARFLLQSGKVPCKYSGKRTRCYTIKKNDVIASVCKVMSSELEASVEEESRAQWALKSENIRRDNLATSTEPELDEKTESSDDIEPSEQ